MKPLRKLGTLLLATNLAVGLVALTLVAAPALSRQYTEAPTIETWAPSYLEKANAESTPGRLRDLLAGCLSFAQSAENLNRSAAQDKNRLAASLGGLIVILSLLNLSIGIQLRKMGHET